MIVVCFIFSRFVKFCRLGEECEDYEEGGFGRSAGIVLKPAAWL
jgi:hypothetical protein